MPPVNRRIALSNALHDFAAGNGVTHFGTLKMGLIGRSRIDTHRDLVRPLSQVIRTYGRLRAELPKRAKLEAGHLPFLVGVAEGYDRAGSFDPHLHYFIRLQTDEEPVYRGFLRSRFGRDCSEGADGLKAVAFDKGTPAATRALIFPTGVLNLARPSRPLITRPDARPTFDLQPLRSDWRRATAYVIKQSLSPELITHLHLLNT